MHFQTSNCGAYDLKGKMAASLLKTSFFGWGARKNIPLWFVPVRHRAKVNIQRPKPPHFQRACALEVAKPIYMPLDTDESVQCAPRRKLFEYVEEDHPIEIILSRDLKSMLYDHKFIAIFHVNSISLQEQYEIRKKFHRKKMLFKRFSKRVLELAVQDTAFINILPLIHGYFMDGLVFAKEPDVGQLLKIEKKIPEIILLAGIVENRILSYPELVNYSKLPSLDVMRSQLCATLSSFSQQLVQNLNHHQTILSSSLSQYIKDNS